MILLATQLAMQVFIAGFLRCICICLPFVAFQAYGYYNICHGHTRDEVRPWCKGRIPLLYNFIQSHYWLILWTQTFSCSCKFSFLYLI